MQQLRRKISSTSLFSRRKSNDSLWAGDPGSNNESSICVELLAPRALWCCPRSRAARKKPSPRRFWRLLCCSSSDICDLRRLTCQGRRKSSIKQSFNSAGCLDRMLQAASYKFLSPGYCGCSVLPSLEMWSLRHKRQRNPQTNRSSSLDGDRFDLVCSRKTCASVSVWMLLV